MAADLAALFTDLPAPHPQLPGHAIPPAVPSADGAVIPPTEPHPERPSDRPGAALEKWGPRLVAASPLLALLLFMITRQWWWFLLIPLAGALVYGGTPAARDRPHPWLHAFLDVPAELAEPTARFWAAASGARIGAPWPEHPEFRSLEPATGSRYLHVQRHGGPPRVHLDLTTPDVDAETARLVALGATAGTRERWWQVLSSPGGLPFCLVEETPGRSRPEPVRWPGGHHSRVAPARPDVPADRYRRGEWRVLAAATGWRRAHRPATGVPLAAAPGRLARCGCWCTGSTTARTRGRADPRPPGHRAPTTSTARGAPGWSRLGARPPVIRDRRGGSWVRLADPDGLPFRVAGAWSWLRPSTAPRGCRAAPR